MVTKVKLSNKELKKCLLALSYNRDDYIRSKGGDPTALRKKFNVFYETQKSMKISYLSDCQFTDEDYSGDADVTARVTRDIERVAQKISNGGKYIIIDPHLDGDDETIHNYGDSWNDKSVYFCIWQTPDNQRIYCTDIVVKVYTDGIYRSYDDNEGYVYPDQQRPLEDVILFLPNIVNTIFEEFGYEILIKSIES